MNIYLIGYRGTGKSSVAPIVAELLGPPWKDVDMDLLIEKEAESTIAEIFADEGEIGFRKRESDVLAMLAQQNQKVVATGGGVIERTENRPLLNEGFVVWLTASPEVILERVSADTLTSSRRPNLTSTGGIDEIDKILSRRLPLYQSLARLTLSTESATPEELARSIVKEFTPMAGERS